MFLHPLFLMFLVLILTSTILVASSPSWIMSWVFLEMNLMVFIPSMVQSTNKYMVEASIKYFITQAMASVVILLSLSWFNYMTPMQTLIITFALLMKLGVAPVHFWFVNVSMSISWPSNFILMVPQKIIPLVLINSMTQMSNLYLLTPFILLTLGVGSLGALLSTNMKKIMAYSSMVHSSWVLSSVSSSTSVWLTYFIIYSLILIMVLLNLVFLNINKVMDIYNKPNTLPKAMLLLSILSLAGLPPFSGFFMKLMMINYLVNSHSYYMVSALLLSSLISLFFYSRIAFMSFNMADKSKTKISLSKDMKNNNILISFNFILLLAGFLCFL